MRSGWKASYFASARRPRLLRRRPDALKLRASLRDASIDELKLAYALPDHSDAARAIIKNMLSERGVPAGDLDAWRPPIIGRSKE